VASPRAFRSSWLRLPWRPTWWRRRDGRGIVRRGSLASFRLMPVANLAVLAVGVDSALRSALTGVVNRYPAMCGWVWFHGMRNRPAESTLAVQIGNGAVLVSVFHLRRSPAPFPRRPRSPTRRERDRGGMVKWRSSPKSDQPTRSSCPTRGRERGRRFPPTPRRKTSRTRRGTTCPRWASPMSIGRFHPGSSRHGSAPRAQRQPNSTVRSLCRSLRDHQYPTAWVPSTGIGKVFFFYRPNCDEPALLKWFFVMAEYIFV